LGVIRATAERAFCSSLCRADKALDFLEIRGWDITPLRSSVIFCDGPHDPPVRGIIRATQKLPVPKSTRQILPD
jgi:hypothetical protein